MLIADVASLWFGSGGAIWVVVDWRGILIGVYLWRICVIVTISGSIWVAVYLFVGPARYEAVSPSGQFE